MFLKVIKDEFTKFVKSIFLKLNRIFSTQVFSLLHIVKISIVFFAALLALNFIVKQINYYIVSFNCPYNWPISILDRLTPNLLMVFIAWLVFLLFCFIFKAFLRIRMKIFFIVIAGVLLISGTSIIQGFDFGFESPIKGLYGFLNPSTEISKEQLETIKFNRYYYNALKISDAVYFISNFEQIQQSLICHSRTHPPGAVLTFYILHKIFKHPAIMSIIIASISVTLSLLFFYGILSSKLKTQVSNFVCFLYVLLPPIQIYYLASIDALIASFFLGVLYCFIHPKLIVNILGTLFFLFIASFQTFGFLFLLPVIAGIDIYKRKNIRRFCAVIFSMILIYTSIYMLYGFNYINSFMIASSLENPEGFRLLSEPVSYFFTRIEGILEILVFLGPFLGILAIRGYKIMIKRDAPFREIVSLGILTLLLMFITGAYKTGETARTCLFIYPYLLFPAAVYFDRININPKEQFQVAALVFSQSVFMQLTGRFWW